MSRETKTKSDQKVNLLSESESYTLLFSVLTKSVLSALNMCTNFTLLQAGPGLQAAGGDLDAEVQRGRQEGLEEAVSSENDGAGGERVQSYFPREYSFTEMEV